VLAEEEYCDITDPVDMNFYKNVWLKQATINTTVYDKVRHHLVNVCSVSKAIYTVIYNYGNPYKKWNIFVAWPHLWLKLGMVKPEIMLCETVLNLSTLRYVTAQYPVM